MIKTLLNTTNQIFPSQAAWFFNFFKPILSMNVNEPSGVEDLFLVCHDNKPKLDLEAGYKLPRFGVVDVSTASYYPVRINEASPLQKTKDLESLAFVKKNRFIACQSNALCFYFEVEKQKNDYLANFISEFKLPVPENKFSNIEAITLLGSKICWSHRGGIYAGEEPWTRCSLIDIETAIISPFVERKVIDPFGLSNPLNRAISDHAVGHLTGTDYFIGTIDTEGSEGIESTKDQAYSILYTKYKCLEKFVNTKIEALYINLDENGIIFATDSERVVSRICSYDFALKIIKWCFNLPKGQEYGVGGIAAFVS